MCVCKNIGIFETGYMGTSGEDVLPRVTFAIGKRISVQDLDEACLPKELKSKVRKRKKKKIGSEQETLTADYSIPSQIMG